MDLEITLAGQRKKLRLNPSSNRAEAKVPFSIANPRLWWPHNHGEPYLYRFELALKAGGKTLDRRGGRFGIRTVELVQEPQGNGKTSFYFRLNGRPIFVKGMNWTPCDAIYARITDARYAKLINAAKKANINAFRVWGGGIYEKDIFYELCDREGILVWQDFMFACGMYPQDAEFLKEVKLEAEFQTRRLRRHPCLMVFCGDNECGWGAEVLYGKNRYENGKLNSVVLRGAWARHCPDVPFVPTTPWSPKSRNHNSPDEGNVHLWAHGRSYKSDFYLKCRPRFVTEIGHIAMPPLAVIRRFIPADKLWPIFNEHWRVHSADAVRCQWNSRLQTMFDSIKARGWPAPKTLSELVVRTQQLQAEATRAWVRHFASDPDCWGIFLWNLADCWPQVSDAYIAYPFYPKPAFSVVRREYAKIRR